VDEEAVMIARKPGKVALLLLSVFLLSGCVFWKLTSDRALSNLKVPWQVEDAVVSGDHLYLACGADGLGIVDISNPISPYQVGDSYPLPQSSTIHQLTVSGNEVFLSGEQLHVVDVSNPSSPTVVNSVGNWDQWVMDGLRHGWICAVSGAHLLAASGGGDVRIYTLSDIRTLGSPTPVGSLTFNTGCFDWKFAMLVDGNYLYFSFPCSFSIVDISDMTNPTLVVTRTGSPVSSYGRRCMAVRDHWLYLVYAPEGDTDPGLGYEASEMTFVDITDKTNPGGFMPNQEIGFPAFVSGNYLLSLYGASIRVDDLSDPSEPDLRENLHTRMGGEFLCPYGDYAVVVDTEGTLAVVLIAPYR